jgi:hypothetical protein
MRIQTGIHSRTFLTSLVRGDRVEMYRAERKLEEDMYCKIVAAHHRPSTEP